MIEAIALACAPVVTDGDTIRICGERVRLLAVDSCELGKQRRLDCTVEKARAAKEALRVMIAGKRLRIERHGVDRYGRTVAVIYADGVSVNCEMIRGDWAVYQPRYGRVCG